MNLIISRHAKRRIRLYNIPESTILQMIEQSMPLNNGRYEIVRNADSFAYPIKIVFEIQEMAITLITAYPLKKGIK